MILRRMLGLVFVFGLWAGVRAELEWKALEYDGKLGPGETGLTTRFEFKNSGASPVRIVEIRSPCGCAKASTDHPVYAPGESGVLTAHYAAQGAVGPQQRQLHIRTDEERREPYTLTLRIQIQDWFNLHPRVMSWDRDAPVTTRSARLVIDPEARAELIGVSGAAPPFAVRLVPEAEPGVHRVEVTPETTADSARAVFRLTVRLPSGQEESKTLHVRVR